MLDSWLQDVRYAARLLRRNPIFAATAALSLAIGIGANTTIFTIANTLLFKPPAGVVDPGRIVDVGRSQDGQGFDNGSYPNYLDIQSRNTVFDGIYAYRPGPEPMSLGGREGAERIYGNLVTSNYFSVLGTRPLLGRLFSADDSQQPGAAPVVVLSHHFWVRRFNREASLVGRTIDLNGRPFTVIGIAPEGFHGTSPLTADVWVPLTMIAEVMPRRSASLLTGRASVWLLMGARLKPGVSVRQAQSELENIARTLEREFPEANRGKGLRVVALSPIPGNGAPVAAFLSVLTAVVSLVLAIACANVAGVLLARATSRRREIAVRLAIGAGRGRLVRQMLVETSLLFLIGAAAGLAIARGMTTLLVSMLPTLPVPVDVSLPLDLRAVAFTVGLSLVAAMLSGLAPALHGSRAEVLGGLKADGQGGSDRLRLRNAFVVSQVAFSIVLVIAAGLFVRALQRAGDISPGFDPHGVELASLDLSLAGYTDQTGRVFARDLIQRIRDVRGVQSATLAAMVPLGNGGMGLGGLTVPGVVPPQGRRTLDADGNIVTPGYFSTMKIPLVAGRDFTDADSEAAASVAIVNETAARLWLGGADAIGKTMLQQDGRPGAPDATRTLTIVGIAHDSKYRSIGEDPRPFVYVPLQQQYLSRLTILARSADGRRVAADIRQALTSMDRNLPLVSAQTLDDYASLGLIPQRIAASVSASLGIVGLLLSAIGIYGVTAYMVSSRTREIGIRVALGAQYADIVRMVVSQGMMLVAIGAAVGVVLAAAAGRLVASLLMGVAPMDATTFAGAVALFATIGIVACYVPARRALQVNANEALHHD